MTKEVLTENDDDIDIVEVDAMPGEEAKAQAAAEAEAAAEKAKEDPDEDDDHEDDEESQEDSRLADRDEDDDDRERIKEERRAKRQKRKDARDRTLEELRTLREEVALLRKGQTQLQGAQVQNAEAQVEQRLSEVRKDIADADVVMAQALKDGDGDIFVQAQNLRDEAKDRERQLIAAKETFKKPSGDVADPEVVQLATAWKAANPWYRTDGSDPNSAVVNRIDSGLIAEGWNPGTRAYYQELTRRVSAQLNGGERQERAPRKETTVDGETTRRKAPPLGSRGDSPNGGKRQVFLSKERVDAIKAAGAWDDPKERAELIKAYEQYDREHSAAG